MNLHTSPFHFFTANIHTPTDTVDKAKTKHAFKTPQDRKVKFFCYKHIKYSMYVKANIHNYSPSRAPTYSNIFITLPLSWPPGREVYWMTVNQRGWTLTGNISISDGSSPASVRRVETSSLHCGWSRPLPSLSFPFTAVNQLAELRWNRLARPCVLGAGLEAQSVCHWGPQLSPHWFDLFCSPERSSEGKKKCCQCTSHSAHN